MTGEVLVFDSVEKRFGTHSVLRGVSATISLNDVTFVVGKSGGGKSVLCRLAVGLLKADAGAVRLLGKTVGHLNGRQLQALRAEVPYLVQGSALLDWLTLDENVALAARGSSISSSQALARLGLTAFAQRRPREVGPGIAKRTAIARALMLGPKYLVLDEPTTGLDREAATLVTDAIAQLKREGLGALVVSHDYRALEAVASTVLEVRDGVVGFLGPAADFVQARQKRATP
jgi:phospholipid/cholesterol/gamma-HCH transport system ATP-binding protein